MARENGSEVTPLLSVCGVIQEAARRGLMQIQIDAQLSDDDLDWLDINGYEVWTRIIYRATKYLITWENADT